MFDKFVEFVRAYYQKPDGFIALHEPRFTGNERKYVMDAIDSTFVSSVGRYVDLFESMIRDYTNAKYAIATTNGTSALHMALLVSGVQKNDLVITQPLTFIATCNAISYLQAEPLFIDIDEKTLGLSATCLKDFLVANSEIKNGQCIHKASGRRISACVPMHTFGHPVEIDRIAALCEEYHISLIEDAAESLGSTYDGKQTGTFGLLGIYSFNGNKTITCGGGGMIVTNDEKIGKFTKHLTTQAKQPHPWDFTHDHIGYNYRLPNLNAAMACAQLEQLDKFIENKRNLTAAYRAFFAQQNIRFVDEPAKSKSNFWLNAVLLEGKAERDAFLKYTNDNKVMTRPAWTLMNKLKMFKSCIAGDLSTATRIEERLVNIPSSVKPDIEI
jgi:perosamine synthetase